jgi:hypothetical protein
MSPRLNEAVSCGHGQAPFGVPLCLHLRTAREPWLKYVKWFVGSGLDTEFICVDCAEARDKGLSAETAFVCRECFQHATTEIGELTRTGGNPEIRVVSKAFDQLVHETLIPKECKQILDIAPIKNDGRSMWLLLSHDGRIWRFDAGTEKLESVGQVNITAETVADSFAGHTLTTRLHASQDSQFAALVNDYGRYGQVIDLRSGKITLNLDGGDYCPETVPFSFAFASRQGQVVAIHRTAWNRLDISDASTGELLSDRGPTSYRNGEQRPEHYLDYFHGALYLSPQHTHILDDGWVWHPVGIPVVWSLEQWLSGNIWESEDGPTKRDVCARTYYWDHGVAWLDEKTVAIGGIGDDDAEMVDGARIFDIALTGTAGPQWRSDWSWAREISVFAGPAGRFFSDGDCLYSVGKDGLSQWDPKAGVRTGHIENFCPTHHHVDARELVQLRQGSLLRWSMCE